jgi:hypothetical protein
MSVSGVPHACIITYVYIINAVLLAQLLRHLDEGVLRFIELANNEATLLQQQKTGTVLTDVAYFKTTVCT